MYALFKERKLRIEIRTKMMQEKKEKICLTYIWQNQHENNTKRLGTVIKEPCNNNRETKFIFYTVGGFH
jgi:hypothetical protein